MSNVSKSRVLSVVLLALMLVSLNARAREISGVWADPNQSGGAVTLLQEGEVVSGAWYFYDPGGIDTWLVFVGLRVNDTMTADLLRFTGLPLGSLFDPAQVQSTVVGRVTLAVRSRGVIDLDYSVTEGDDRVIGTLRLVPFAMTVSNTEQLAEFAGFYSGRFTDDAGIFGTGNGLFVARTDHYGNLTGLSVFSFSGRSCSLAGTFTANGEVTFSTDCGIGAVGSSGTGVITPSGLLSGTWVSDTGLSSGTFSGSRQD